jgi:hypothetical protein
MSAFAAQLWKAPFWAPVMMPALFRLFVTCATQLT